MLSEQIQCQSQMLFMLFLLLRVNKNVIKENKNKLIQIPAEDTIHKAHKCSRCIRETKRYHYKLIMPIPCPEGCLMNVFILDPYLMVTRPQVNLGKYPCSSHLIKEVINPRQRIFILHSNLVQLSVINTQPECTIFLLYKQNWCSPRRHTWSDILLFQKILQLHL